VVIALHTSVNVLLGIVISDMCVVPIITTCFL